MFSTCKSVNDNFNKRSFFMEQSVPVSSNTFWGNPFLGPPFLKKGPRKLQKGANFFSSTAVLSTPLIIFNINL